MRNFLGFILLLVTFSGLSADGKSTVTMTGGERLEKQLLADFHRTGNVHRLRAEAGTAYKRFKRKPVPAYLLAYAEFLSGNLEGARSLAEEAARWAGSEVGVFRASRYPETVKRLREGHPAPFELERPSNAEK